MKVKLGQIIKFKADFYINLIDEKVLVKKGDTAKVVRKIDDKTGEILYLTGNAKDRSQCIDMEVDDTIDPDAIAKKILSQI